MVAVTIAIALVCRRKKQMEDVGWEEPDLEKFDG